MAGAPAEAEQNRWRGHVVRGVVRQSLAGLDVDGGCNVRLPDLKVVPVRIVPQDKRLSRLHKFLGLGLLDWDNWTA